MAQHVIDTSLLNNSDKWKPKISLLVIANTLKKVSIGSLETVDIDKGEKNITRSKNKSLQAENGAWGVVKDYTVNKKQSFDIKILSNNTDSIFLNMKTEEISQGAYNGSRPQ